MTLDIFYYMYLKKFVPKILIVLWCVKYSNPLLNYVDILQKEVNNK